VRKRPCSARDPWYHEQCSFPAYGGHRRWGPFTVHYVVEYDCDAEGGYACGERAWTVLSYWPVRLRARLRRILSPLRNAWIRRKGNRYVDHALDNEAIPF
jgi:hypothetical protein